MEATQVLRVIQQGFEQQAAQQQQLMEAFRQQQQLQTAETKTVGLGTGGELAEMSWNKTGLQVLPCLTDGHVTPPELSTVKTGADDDETGGDRRVLREPEGEGGKTEQARGGQKYTQVPMEVDHVGGSEPEEEDWDDVDEVRRRSISYNCGTVGHLTRDCRRKGKGKDGSKGYARGQGETMKFEGSKRAHSVEQDRKVGDTKVSAGRGRGDHCRFGNCPRAYG